jgi:hypothetical protein
MSELGKTLRSARELAGLSLTGMARRTGYSRSYLGNVETGAKPVTPDVIRSYEKVLGDDSMHRRNLFGGMAGAFVVAGIGVAGHDGAAAAAVPAGSVDQELATDLVRDIMSQRKMYLSSVVTSHETDRAIGAVVARQTPCLATLQKWMRAGSAVLRANSAGILAKTGSPVFADEVAVHLNEDGDARDLYLTAVVARVLGLPWEEASRLAGAPQFTEAQVRAIAAEVANGYDAGARWCSVHLLGSVRQQHHGVVDVTLRQALSTETSRELLRHIGLTRGKA